MSYEISKTEYIKLDDITLKKYADVLVKFCLGNGKGCKKGDVVRVNINESAKPLVSFLVKAINESGGIPSLNYKPHGYLKDYYNTSSDEQLSYVDKAWDKAVSEHIDHTLSIISSVDDEELKDIDSSKIILTSKANGELRKLFKDLESKSLWSWCIALYPTIEMADRSGLTIDEYVEQVVKACYLDEVDPVKKMREKQELLESLTTKLDDMEIKKVHIIDDNGTDIEYGIGKDRAWKSGGTVNVPTFEIFTTPNKIETNGKIYITEPLSANGNIIEDIYMEFKDGKVVEYSASKGKDLLKSILETDEGARYVGEFALTDSRISKISRFMGNTLYDENVGGKTDEEGNFIPSGSQHYAIGSSYRECYKGDISKMTDEDFNKRNYNDSIIHYDMVTTAYRTVTATLYDGSEVIIFKDGQFTI